jgi:hypothetical protein
MKIILFPVVFPPSPSSSYLRDRVPGKILKEGVEMKGSVLNRM